MSTPSSTNRKPDSLGRKSAHKNQAAQNSFETLVQENATRSNALQIPDIALPKGGGALKGIDEKFRVNAANGTAGFNIPLQLTPARNGFSPALSLSYNSGGGNSPYGLGWSVDFPIIQRKTDRSLPRYRDELQEDTFLLSGAEDLVPLLEEQLDGRWVPVEVERGEYRVKQYRPRVEGDFARIEKISHPSKGIYWKVTTRDNVATIFGRDADSRIVSPEDRTKISHWLPEFSYDDKGNWIEYSYKEENLENVPDKLHERNRRNGTALFTNKYLKQIRYGNRLPYDASTGPPEDPPSPVETAHFFLIVWDYGEHHPERPTPAPDPGRRWNDRPDAFSSYRTGFEIRTHRLCKRILHFHQFAELGAEPCLVRSMDFDYEPSSINRSAQTEVTYLKSITQTGYVRKADGSYAKKSLPKMEFGYERLQWNEEIKVVDEESIAQAPAGLSNNYLWADLFGEGVSGILTEQAEGWYYKSNLGDVDDDGQVRFTAARKVIPKPSFTGMTTGVLSLQDLEADGQRQIVVNSPGVQGYFELTPDNNWKPFRAFPRVARLDVQDPHTRLIDLNGDGQPELVVTEDRAFVWYASKGKEGHEAAEWVAKSFDEERGPAIVFADLEQTIFLADMTGDGLTDIVRIRNGEICYWANKGYGSFSAKVTMDNSPWFDYPDLFNPTHLYLADVSGTGATDLVYLGKNKFTAFLNLSGNAWSDAHEIEPIFPIDSRSKIAVIDLLGTGTSCIVWSSDAPAERRAPMRYIDLMSGRKPHVLKRYVNNLGKETHLEYKSSTYFYLKDKLADRPWITKLPFPVQVVSKLIEEEKITGVRFTTEYRYHHGYYDHPEREFRGFGMVEQLDTEHYATWAKNNAGNQLASSAELYQKPALTKTWFHTGAFLDRERMLTHFKDEYWYEEMGRQGFTSGVHEPELTDARLVAASSIRDPSLLDKLSTDEWRETLRACKGMMLRQEVFALDAPDAGATVEQIRKQLTPYTVATHNCRIQLLQPRDKNRHAVFLVTESEAITFNYEREVEDPRVAHTLHVKIDELGNILEAAAVVYPRRRVDDSLPAEIQDEQRKTFITYTRNNYTNDVARPGAYRLRLLAEAQTFEITNLTKPAAQPLYRPADFDELFDRSTQIEYQATATGASTERRLIEHLQTLYYNHELTGSLALGRLDSTGLPFESYQLALTPNLLADIFGDKLPAASADLENLLGDNDRDREQSQCKFVHRADANWWIRSGTIQYLREGEDRNQAQRRFFSPLAYTDPSGATTRVSYYGDYFLMMESVEDALHNRFTVERFNFRTLTAERVRDPNENLSSVLLDELGLVKATALEGKDLDGDGVAEIEVADNLDGLEEDTEGESSDIGRFFETEDSAELQRLGRGLLKNATSRFVYDFHRYQSSQAAYQAEPNECARTRKHPTVVASIIREQHHAQNPSSPLQLLFEYSDGLGRVAMRKAQAEPGIAVTLEAQPDCSFSMSEVNTAAQTPARLRWVGNGRTVLNNKGNPVKQYEPYFSVTPRYEDAKELVETGVTPVMHYDSLGRLIKTEFPDQTFSRVEFTAWKQMSYDRNDTVMDSVWYEQRINHRIDAALIAAGKDPAQESAAAERAGAHHDTPALLHLDTLGRPVLSVEHNRREGRDEFYRTRIVRDIEGNARRVVDARGNIVMSYKYDMLGHRLYQESMDAGERWVLNDVAGKPVQAWDSLAHRLRYTYDELHRQIGLWLAQGEAAGVIVERNVYGEAHPQAAELNLRGKPFMQLDAAGVVTNEGYDFKGNLLRGSRRLAREYQRQSDWSSLEPSLNPILPEVLDLRAIAAALDARLEAGAFTSNITYDALSRPVRVTSPDRSTFRPAYNEANLLGQVDVQLRGEEDTGGEAVWTAFVANIDYDAKGRRTFIEYGNGVSTTYTYDAQTFRLTNLRTTRGPSFPAAERKAQDLYYTYDPVGNITFIRDDAQQTVYFNNTEINPSNSYSYDSLYRLTRAEGREHAAQNNPQRDHLDFAATIGIPFPNSPEALQRYIEEYEYDSVGNIKRMRHTGGREVRWTRRYQYAADSNRLTATSQPDDPEDAYSLPYAYDAHGNMTSMPHLRVVEWDFKNQLHATQRQAVLVGTGEKTYYVYDAAGERVRKVTESAGGAKLKERIYLGGFELYREYQSGEIDLERETLHVMDGEHRLALVETKTQEHAHEVSESSTIRYQHGNHLGSACLELDERGNVITYEEYHPYGTTAYQSARSIAEVNLKRYRYTGKERDEETGLAYHGARYYAAWLGRWTAADPSGIKAGINLYEYVLGNPLINTDPTGLTEVTIYHRTSDESAASMTSTGARLDMNRPHVWAGGGFYGSSIPAIPSSAGARGDVIVAQRISIDRLENLDVIGDPRIGTRVGRNITTGLQNSDAGVAVRRQIYRQMYDEGNTQARAYGRRPSDEQVNTVFRDYMTRQLNRAVPNADVVRWRNPDGTFTYVVRRETALIGSPTIAGRMVGNDFEAASESSSGNVSRRQGVDDTLLLGTALATAYVLRGRPPTPPSAGASGGGGTSVQVRVNVTEPPRVRVDPEVAGAPETDAAADPTGEEVEPRPQSNEQSESNRSRRSYRQVMEEQRRLEYSIVPFLTAAVAAGVVVLVTRGSGRQAAPVVFRFVLGLF